MDNIRLIQLINMFSHISNKTYDEARSIILSTNTGKAIQDNNVTLIYEQQTENLYSIVMDLQKSNFDNELTKRFTIETIVSSLEVINEDEELGRIVVPIAKDPELKKSHQELLKKHQRKILMEKQQNYMNVRRTESADKFKREKQ